MTRGVLSAMTMILAPSSSETHALSGIFLAAASFALLTFVDIIFKVVAVDHSTYQILATNGCFALIPILGWAILTGGLRRLRTARLARHLMRGSISVASGFLAVYAYSRLPLTDFYAIVFVGPLLVTMMSCLWLREAIGRQRWLAIIIGFLGVLIVTNPFNPLSEKTISETATAITLGRVAAFGSVFCYALSVTMIRHMRARETNLAFSLYGYIASITISGGLWLLHCHDGLSPMTWLDVGHLALSGLLAGTASIFLMTAYHRTPVSLVAPFQYTQIIWAAMAGYLLWAHLPDLNLILGAMIVTASGLFLIYSEARIKGIRPLIGFAQSHHGIQSTEGK